MKPHVKAEEPRVQRIWWSQSLVPSGSLCLGHLCRAGRSQEPCLLLSSLPALVWMQPGLLRAWGFRVTVVSRQCAFSCSLPFCLIAPPLWPSCPLPPGLTPRSLSIGSFGLPFCLPLLLWVWVLEDPRIGKGLLVR